MRFLPAFLLSLGWGAAAIAQAVPIDVEFKLVGMKDNYDAEPAPLVGQTVRLVLGEAANWQDPGAGRQFVTDAKGEARFTMDAPLEARTRSRNIGFTPLRMPSRAEHLKIAVELEHKFSLDKDGPPRTFRWMLTMDLDCFKDGECRTVGFMGIYTPDAQGRFTKALVRQGGTESWKVPELGDKVVWGMSYQVADFMLGVDEKDPQKRTLKFAVKRLAR